MIEKYIKEIQKMVPSAFQKKGDTIYLFGETTGDEFNADPAILLPLVNSIKEHIVQSVCFLDALSLRKALIECGTPNMLGFDITTDSEMDEDEFMDKNCGKVAVITVNGTQEDDFVDKMFDNEIPLTLLGHVTKGDIRIDDEKYGAISDYIQ